MTTFNQIAYGGTRGQPVPVVGMGATQLFFTDRRAGTIVKVGPTGKTGYPTWVLFQADTATRTDGNGMSESQSYSYERDPNGNTARYSLRKNGAYVRQGETMRGGQQLRVGDRAQYYDYSF